MATSVPRWLKVCGIGCGLAVLLAVGLVVGGFFLLRASIRQFEVADRSFDVVAERYGEIASFRPEPEGLIRADRLEAFLAARDGACARRKRMEDALTLLSPRDSEGRAGLLPKVRGTVGLMRNLAPFHRERNEALLRSEVGLGEYYYLYTLVYYSWLGKSPADGPPFKIVSAKGYLLETIEFSEEPVVRRYREEQARLSLNRLLLPILRNQLADLSTRRDRGELRAFGEMLASEIAALEADARRLPWEDGLPDVLERSLRPYRDRLNESYSSMCNAIEIGLARRAPRSAALPAHGGTAVGNLAQAREPLRRQHRTDRATVLGHHA